MIRSFLRKRAARKTFGNLASEDTVEAFRVGRSEGQPLEEGDIEYVLAFVRGNTPTLISERVGNVAYIAFNHGAVVHAVVGSFVAVAFGTLPTKHEQPGDRPALVEELHQSLGDDIKILHGAGRGYFGLIGNQAWQSHSFLLPQFDAMLGVLSQLDFGQTQEFTP